MTERINYLNCKYQIDGDFRLHYGSELQALDPCQRVTDPNIIVGIVDNSLLPAQRLLILPKDRSCVQVRIPTTGAIVQLPLQGKSASLYFDDAPMKETIHDMVRRHLHSKPDRRDHLHLSLVGWIEEAGWQVWWAPLQERNNLVHVRIIANSTAEKGEDPTIEEATKLATSFVKAC
jgi:hypothetical protein